MRPLHCAGVSLLTLLSCLALTARADSPATQPAKFIRYVDRGPQGGELDTADVAYTNGKGVTVHLVAAVHIGERGYYDELANGFADYDIVLYELIKSKNAAPPAGDGAGERSQALISRFQIFLKEALNLDFQLDDIDYTKPNFVNADLDKDTFEKMEADRGESMMTLMLQQMMNAWQNPPAAAQADMADQLHELVRLFCSPDGQRQFKLVIAQQMDTLEDAASGLGGPDGTVIVSERNKAALAQLDKSMADGKKKIAIFYGAAHMRDMSKRLGEMGFTPVDTQWHRAWDLTIRLDQPSLDQWDRVLCAARELMGKKTPLCLAEPRRVLPHPHLDYPNRLVGRPRAFEPYWLRHAMDRH